MTIFAIFEDNGQSYEDHYSGIMKDNVYLNRQKAEDKLEELNKSKIFTNPTIEQYNNSGNNEYQSYEEYCADEESYHQWNMACYRYSIIELNVID